MAENLSDADLYPMRIAARVTGLPPDTIRAWERRYGAVEPCRTVGNARRYSGLDIRKLSLLRALTERGQAIGAIAQLDLDALESLVVGNDDQPDADGGQSVDPLGRTRRDYLDAVQRVDVARASRILFHAAAVLDNRELVFDLVVPIVQEVGTRWTRGELCVAQEHLVSAELRTLLSTRMHRQPADAGAPRMVIATPAGHRHEFGVLGAAMLANGRGIDVLYLGPDLPDDELSWAVDASRADVLVLGIARELFGSEAAALHTTVERLSSEVDVWLGCPAGLDLGPLPTSLRRFDSLEAFEVAVAGLHH